jgi:hypothetical protein
MLNYKSSYAIKSVFLESLIYSLDLTKGYTFLFIEIKDEQKNRFVACKLFIHNF